MKTHTMKKGYEKPENSVEQRAHAELLKVESALLEADAEFKTVTKQMQSLGTRGAELQQKLVGLREKKNVLHTVLGYLDGVAPAGRAAAGGA